MFYLLILKARTHFVSDLAPAHSLSFLYSEGDEDRRGTRNGQSGKSEFKDDAETVTTKSVQIVQATETTRKRGGIPSKAISLGAAANYTGDKPSSNTNTSQVDVRNTSYQH